MTPELVLPRHHFLDLLSGDLQPLPRIAAEHRSRILAACAIVSVDVGPAPASLWLGPTHTTIASGRDPTTLRTIKTANVALAVVTLLALGIRDGHGPGSWDVRCTSPAGRERISGFHRPPDVTWTVTEDRSRTLVRRERLDRVSARIATALETALEPIGASTLA